MIPKSGVATHLGVAKILQCVTKKANVLLILEDDHSYEVMCVSKNNGSLKVAQHEKV